MLQAAIVRVNWASTRFTPRSIVCAIGPTVLAQPKVRRIRRRSSRSLPRRKSIFFQRRCEIVALAPDCPAVDGREPRLSPRAA